jgi:hypothetical protein
LLPQSGNPLGDNNPALGQQASDLIDESGTVLNEATAHPMDGLDILALYGLERHEAQRGAVHSI